MGGFQNVQIWEILICALICLPIHCDVFKFYHKRDADDYDDDNIVNKYDSNDDRSILDVLKPASVTAISISQHVLLFEKFPYTVTDWLTFLLDFIATTEELKLYSYFSLLLKVDLPAIKGHYQQVFGRSLREDVKKDTSGDYGKTLLAVLDKVGDANSRKKDNKKPVKKSPPAKTATQSNKNKENDDAKKDKETTKSPRGKDKKEDDKKEKPTQAKKSEKETKEGDDATKLYKAMSGIGTDEDALIEVIVRNSNAGRQNVKRRYLELYDQVSPIFLFFFLLNIDLYTINTHTDFLAECT